MGGGNGTLPELLQQPPHTAEAETLIKECQRGERSLKIIPHDRKINLLAMDPVHMEKCVHLDKSKTLKSFCIEPRTVSPCIKTILR